MNKDMTTTLVLGVYDTFHFGHMKFITKAAGSEGHVIVGVQDDESVERQKGSRPAHSIEERCEYARSVKRVADVFVYGDNTGPIPVYDTVTRFMYVGDISSDSLRRIKDSYPGIEYVQVERDHSVSSTLLKGHASDIRIGIDYHDTVTFDPAFFHFLISVAGADCIYIITGTPPSGVDRVRQELIDIGIHPRMYADILCGFEYSHDSMDTNHFQRMADHKRAMIHKYKIDVYFDDNPFYVNAMRDDVTTFMTVMPDKYIDGFRSDHPFLTCNLQKGLFDKFDAFEDKCQSFWKRRAADHSGKQSHQTSFGTSQEVQTRWRREEEQLSDLLSDVNSDSLTVYEPGCGHGHFTKILAEYFNCVISTDLCEEFVDMVRSLEFDNVVTGVAVAEPTDADVLFCGGIMPYLDETTVDALLSHGYRHIIFAESFFDKPMTVNRFDDRIEDVYHSTYRTLDWWNDRFTRNGYSVEYIKVHRAEQENRSHRVVLRADQTSS